MDKINRQLHSGRKLTKSGKADGQELKDTERQKLEADKAKWLDMKEKAKNDKHDERMNNINSHTTTVGADVKRHITNEMGKFANSQKRTKKEQQKSDNPFKGKTVTYQEKEYIVDESFQGLRQDRAGKTWQYRLLLKEDVEAFNATMKAAMSRSEQRADKKEKYKNHVIIGQTELDGLIAGKVKLGALVKTRHHRCSIPAGWQGNVARISKNQIMVKFSVDDEERFVKLLVSDVVVVDAASEPKENKYTPGFVEGKYIKIKSEDRKLHGKIGQVREVASAGMRIILKFKEKGSGRALPSETVHVPFKSKNFRIQEAAGANVVTQRTAKTIEKKSQPAAGKRKREAQSSKTNVKKARKSTIEQAGKDDGIESGSSESKAEEFSYSGDENEAGEPRQMDKCLEYRRQEGANKLSAQATKRQARRAKHAPQNPPTEEKLAPAPVGGPVSVIEDDEQPQDQADCFGPAGPDGKPLFAHMPEFVAVYLVFASDFLVRVGKVHQSVFDHYLDELRIQNASMATAYVETAHCTMSFLTDTTTLKLLHGFLQDGEITANSLYNIIIAQTVLPSWRKIEKLGPFNVNEPPTPEDFAKRFQDAYPEQKAVVPSHLKQGVLGLLGNGSEVESAGRFVFDLAAKVPAALERLRGESGAMTVLQEDFGLPYFRALMVARILSLADRRLYDFEHGREIGDYAQVGLWLLEGMPPEQARAAAKDSWNTSAVDPLFKALIDAMPAAIADGDIHGVVGILEKIHLAPLCAQNIEHMLCEFRKMTIPEGRTASGERFEGYADLWKQCETILARRAA